MGITSVFQGHWRALENRWLIEFDKTREQRTVAVITAGQPLAERLMGLIPGSVAGARFLPGFPALSKILTSSVTGGAIPESQQVAFAGLSGYMAEGAEAAAVFFEKLIEMGVSAETFSVIANSTKGLHREVLNTAEKFSIYSSFRNNLHPFSPDRVREEGPASTHRFHTCMFYGFYDLNPAQRNYVRRLSRSADIIWFSPVHPSHHWRETSRRTMDLLMELGIGETHRVDASVPLSPLAQFAENLLTGKTLGEIPQLELLLCGSGTGFTKAVTDRVRKLMNRYETDEIAVISTGEEAKLLTDQFHTAGIPCSSSLTVKASELPAGRFLERLLKLGNNRFHHRDIEKLLLTNVISIADTPDANEYSKEAEKQGARFGLNALRKTQFPFTSILADFFHELPEEAPPEEFLALVTQLLKNLCGDSIPGIFADTLLKPELFAIGETVSFNLFKEMIRAALDVPVKLKEPAGGGIAIISPEKARGIQKKALVITGMEEGGFPRKAVIDPRLPVEVKKQLQLPSPDMRETEEAFLLRQTFEAAENEIAIICRNVDASGRALAVSPFLAPLVRKNSPLKSVPVSDSPLNVLSIPSNPPFLLSSAECQLERLRYDPEDPSPGAVHCGMTGSGYSHLDSLSATGLENYVRDPFSYLNNRIWKVSEAGEFPVRSEPDPLSRGQIVHQCVEKALQAEQPVADIVRAVCGKERLEALLGSNTLADIWIEHLVSGINKLTSQLKELKWSFMESEKNLEGTVAGFSAGGRIDLIFRNEQGEFILADLKTGKIKPVKNGQKVTIIKNGLFQLPFYRDLAVQNGYKPIAEAAYIYLHSNGDLTFRSLTNSELLGVQDEFEEKVKEIVTAINQGNFHQIAKKESFGSRR